MFEKNQKKAIIIDKKKGEQFMARIHETFQAKYSLMQKEDLQNPVIFVVDMINGFIKEGALHDEQILTCAKPIEELLQNIECSSIFVADAHPPKTREFISYPSHCVIGTAESEVVDELQPYIEKLYHKNSTNTFTCPAFQEFLEEAIYYYDDIIITGCCTDICILQFVLCLNAWLNEHNETSKRIIIPLDSVDTYHIEGIHDAIMTNEFAISNMEANGITIVSHIESREV